MFAATFRNDGLSMVLSTGDVPVYQFLADYHRQLNLRGQRLHDEETFNYNVFCVQEDANAGVIKQPKTYDEWLRAVVDEFMENIKSFSGQPAKPASAAGRF